jgi:ribonucleoside-diphosphate reductase alpha chain
MDISQKILSDITIFNKYAKYVPEKQRRETWDELVTRNLEMHIKKYPDIRGEIINAYKYVYDRKVLPSMRSLQFGGAPIELANNRMFNCAFTTAEHPAIFSETMFNLLGGSGVGFSVQSRHVSQLPKIVGPSEKQRRFLVGDSIEGWADAVKVLIKAYTLGKSDPVFDFRDIRPKGSRLITSGGKAPGPDPLRICLDKLRSVLNQSVGRQLKPIEVHDMICHIADAVLSGGIRRAALISLFDKDDMDMLSAKGQLVVDDWEFTLSNDMYFGWVYYKTQRVDLVLSPKEYEDLIASSKVTWYHLEPQRGRANNSAVLKRGEVTEQEWFALWKKVENSGSGEPGVFWTNDYDMGTNPCAEIALNPNQYCNLVETNASDITTQEELNARVKAATLIGTLQAGYTDFHYLRNIWKETTEREALLGVSMTGIGSGTVLHLNLEEAAKVCVEENKRVATLIGINSSARITTVKPAGTTSLVLGSSSGVHAWHNDYYIRRMRVGKNEPLYAYMKAKVPALIEDCYFKPHLEAVMSFPQKAPDNAIYRTESFKDTLERVKRFNLEWIDNGHVYGNNKHNVSCTISLKADEWEEAGKWMWENKDNYTGISVLPYDGGTYIQAPFEDCSKETFEELFQHLESIDLTLVKEDEDLTTTKENLACAGGFCEVT